MSRHLMTSSRLDTRPEQPPDAARDRRVGLVLEVRDPLEVLADVLHAIELVQRAASSTPCSRRMTASRRHSSVGALTS